jgi:hypothetical protein
MRLGFGLDLATVKFPLTAADPPAPFVGPLDQWQDDFRYAFAFGHRLFSSVAPSWRIRRSSDSAVEDFTTDAVTGRWGSDVLAFLNGGVGTVVNGLDQAGGLFPEQATAANQLEIGRSGALQAFGNGYGVTSSGDWLAATLSPLILIPQPITLFAVLNVTSVTNGGGPIAFSAGSSGVVMSSSKWSVRLNSTAVDTGVTVTTGANQILRVVFDGANSHLAINNGTPTAFSLGTGTITVNGVLFGRGTSAALNGKWAFAGVMDGRWDDGSIEAALGGIW